MKETACPIDKDLAEIMSELPINNEVTYQGMTGTIDGYWRRGLSGRYTHVTVNHVHPTEEKYNRLDSYQPYIWPRDGVVKI